MKRLVLKENGGSRRMAESSIGQSIVRREGLAKLTGTARFVDDLPRDQVWLGATVRADVSHARLDEISWSPDFDWQRVVVITAADIPGENVVPVVWRDQPALASREIRYRGEPVALIAAPDERTLHEALAQVTVKATTLPAIFDLDSSRAAQIRLHGQDNRFRIVQVRKGSAQDALRHADLVLERTYETEAQEHVYLEPQGIQAEPTADGILIRGSTQCPYYMVESVSTLLQLPPERVRVVATPTGGGFGGKEDFPSFIAGHAALLAWKARRPVRLIYDRVEDLRFTSKRHPSRIRLKTGWTRTGQLIALQAELLLDGGAYSTLSPLVLQRAVLHLVGPYRCEQVEIVGEALATNYPPRGAFRGFGAPQAAFARETHFDEAAAALGLDPLELRRQNRIQEGETLSTGQIAEEARGVESVLEQAAAAADFLNRRRQFAESNRHAAHAPAPHRFLRHGIGMALYNHGTGLNGNCEADFHFEVKLQADAKGQFHAITDQVEIGQGSQTVLAQCAAEGLAVPVDWVVVDEPDTSEAPNSGPTVASRTTSIVGGLLIQAGRQLRAEVERHAGRPLPEPEAFRDAVQAYVRERTENGPLCVRRMHHAPADFHWDDTTQAGHAYLAYAWGACVVAVEVDTLTGQARVLDATLVHDVGRVIHPLFAAGQAEGGFVQGLGWALMEKGDWSDGWLRNGNMTDYVIPTASDVPPMRTIFVETPTTRVPHGAKGLGEITIEGAAPAIANALHQALGKAFRTLPVTPEKILPACEESV
jgi:CO/xanthine dehydrogenase Mo-binding subunit